MTSRRSFITLLGGAVATWPMAARAQQGVKRIGIVVAGLDNDTETKMRIAAFKLGLAQHGWTENRNVRIDTRQGAGDAARLQASAAELVRLAPDVILVTSLAALSAANQATRNIPIVFVNAVDPVAAGLVSSFARPDSNITGFTSVESATSAKWLELLREIDPQLSRALVIFNSSGPAAAVRLPAIEVAAQSAHVRLTKADVRGDADIERAIDGFAHEPNGGVIVLPSPINQGRRDTIITRSTKHRIPAVYPDRLYVVSGGLMSYGTDIVEQCRQAAGYVDRILKGAKPGELPIQQPTKFELVINLKTAKASGLEVPWFLQQRADEVIE